MFSLLVQDFRRYAKDGYFNCFEPSLLCIFLYRIGHSILHIKILPLRFLLTIIHLPFFDFQYIDRYPYSKELQNRGRTTNLSLWLYYR